MSSKPDPRTRLLLDALDGAFQGRSFHGTTLTGALRGMDVERATWRAGPKRKTIWEYLLHAAYWKYVVRRHVGGDDSIRFERKPSDWPRVPAEPTQADLKRDIAFLKEEHRLLGEAVAAFDPAKLYDSVTGKSGHYASIIQGVAAHDLYHTGQIQLLKRLWKERA